MAAHPRRPDALATSAPRSAPIVVKATGLAAGRDWVVAMTMAKAKEAAT